MPSPWKQSLKQIGLGLLNLALVIALIVGVQALLRHRVSDSVGLLILSAVVLLAYLAGSRWMERRPPPELSGLRVIPHFFAGLALGIALFSVVMLLLWAFGVYHPAGRGVFTTLGAGFLTAMFAAVVEETITRGFIFRLIEIGGGTWAAVVISSALFGAAHAFNPGATFVSSLAIALEAGVLLAAAYVLTGSLWFPIGLHAGWNFAEGALFGMSVSGTGAKTGLIRGSLSGPAILTGGAFGPEASIVAVIVCFSVAVFLFARAIRARRIQTPLWSRTAPTLTS